MINKIIITIVLQAIAIDVAIMGYYYFNKFQKRGEKR